MNFHEHSELEGRHALLSASKYQWLTQELDAIRARAVSAYATQLGDALHDKARRLISRREKLAKTDRKMIGFSLVDDYGIPEYAFDMDILYPNFMAYVNDAIGFRMTPEVKLFYSWNCFGTTDAIAYRDNFLRIHDYKSGVTPAKIEQLKIYAGLFCLEYANDIHLDKLAIELRIYQGGQVLIHNPSRQEIDIVVNKIIDADNEVRRIKELGV